MNASIAPGQLDGITIACAYPDSETTGMEVGDCVLLAEAYQKQPWLDLMAGRTQQEINAKKAAINGHLDQSGCHAWYNSFGSNGKVGNYLPRGVLNSAGALGPIAAAVTNNCQLPLGLAYDPVTNPTGARCSAWDWAASIFGKTPDGIRARETRDNVGVQYGLKALNDRVISVDQFLDVNERIGGVDIDFKSTAQRTERLLKITAAIAEAVTAREVYAAIVEQVTAALDASSAGLWLVQDDGTLIQVLGTLPGTLPRYAIFVVPNPTGTYAIIGEDGMPVEVGVAISETAMATLPDLSQKPPMESFLAMDNMQIGVKVIAELRQHAGDFLDRGRGFRGRRPGGGRAGHRPRARARDRARAGSSRD